jgi:hypothetical protein
MVPAACRLENVKGPYVSPIVTSNRLYKSSIQESIRHTLRSLASPTPQPMQAGEDVQAKLHRVYPIGKRVLCRTSE